MFLKEENICYKMTYNTFLLYRSSKSLGIAEELRFKVKTYLGEKAFFFLTELIFFGENKNTCNKVLRR